MFRLSKRDRMLEKRWAADALRDKRNLLNAASHTKTPSHRAVLMREAAWAEQGWQVRHAAIIRGRLPRILR